MSTFNFITWRCHEPREPEVAELDDARGGHHHVLGLHVPVDDLERGENVAKRNIVSHVFRRDIAKYFFLNKRRNCEKEHQFFRVL